MENGVRRITESAVTRISVYIPVPKRRNRVEVMIFNGCGFRFSWGSKDFFGMSIFEICQWIQDSSIGTGIRESTYVFPLIEATHVLGLAVSVGTIAIVDLRLIGATMRDQPVTDVIEQLQP